VTITAAVENRLQVLQAGFGLRLRRAAGQDDHLSGRGGGEEGGQEEEHPETVLETRKRFSRREPFDSRRKLPRRSLRVRVAERRRSLRVRWNAAQGGARSG